MKRKLLDQRIGSALPPTAIQFVIDPAYRRRLSLARRITTPDEPNPNALCPEDNCINTPTTEQHPQDYLLEAHYYNTNTVDPDFDIDGSLEFDDSMELDTPDAQFSGLTVVRLGKDTRRWLKGYNIL